MLCAFNYAVIIIIEVFILFLPFKIKVTVKLMVIHN